MLSKELTGEDNCGHECPCSGISVRSQKSGQIVLGDPHEVTQAVGAECARLDPATCGSGRDRASLGHLLHGAKQTGLRSGRGGSSGPRPPGCADEASGAVRRTGFLRAGKQRKGLGGGGSARGRGGSVECAGEA